MAPIIALDFPTVTAATDFLAGFPAGEPLAVKIGMELFYGFGPAVIAQLRGKRQLDIFLDLKLHDIPHTVEQAAYQLGRLGVQLTTAHALGGVAMLEAAVRGLTAGAASVGLPAPKLLAITQLTSTNQTQYTTQQQGQGQIADSVQHLAALAQAAGCAGVVASAQEVPLIRAVVRPEFLVVTPGIRPTATADDQARVATPAQARALGASAIVVGRPITQAENPVAAYRAINQAWQGPKENV